MCLLPDQSRHIFLKRISPESESLCTTDFVRSWNSAHVLRLETPKSSEELRKRAEELNKDNGGR
jgi:hypothetical protein